MNMLGRNNKQIIGVVIIIAAILVGSSGLMAGFDVGDEEAKLYLNGISYNGVKYLSDSALATGLPDSQKFKWQDDEISVDVDGALNVITPVWMSSRIYPIETSAVGGWMPDVSFKFITNPQLIDLNGNDMSSGYTDKLVSEGHDMYVYHYSVKLRAELNAGTISSAELGAGGIVQHEEGITFMRTIDGSVVGSVGLAEIGILKNIYALISVDLPEVDGWTYGWEADIADQDIDFIWSGDGESFDEGAHGDYVKDTYPEGLEPILNDYVAHFNLNDPIKPSHSNNDRISLVNVDSDIVGSIGLDSFNVPGVYNSYYTWQFIWETLHSEWLFMRPVFEYDLVLKVTALNEVAIVEDPDPDPDDPPFPGIKPIVVPEIPQELLMVGGVGLGLIIVVMWWRRRSEYGY